MNRARWAVVRGFGAVVTVVVMGVMCAPAGAAPATPTPTGASPTAPNPRPPRGGIGPAGEAIGGTGLLSRGLVVPAGSPALPAGLTAASWMLTDLDTGAVLAARDPHGRYQPASIQKLLTALVLLPRLPGARLVTASADAANIEGSAVGLVAGGKYTVDTLFRSMLLMSGNDATEALAEATGGPAAVVASMNALARRLGAYDTVVETPSGLDGWKQLTSVYDQSIVLRAAVANARLLAYDQSLTASLPAQQVGTRAWGAVPLFNQSENFLTGVPGGLLAKTGFTDAASHTFTCAAQRGGRRLGVVFLRAQRVPTDQWQQAASLLNWGFALGTRYPAVGTLDAAVVPPAAGVTPTMRAQSSTPSGSSASVRPTATPALAADRNRRPGTSSRWTWINAALIVVTVTALGTQTMRWRRRRG